MKYALRVLAGVVRDGIVSHKTLNVQKHYHPDLSRYKNFSIFASSETICDFNGKDG